MAIITGAGKGIGAGIARTFAQVGAHVVLAARTEADLEQVADEVEAFGRRALVVPTDVLNPDQLGQLVGSTRTDALASVLTPDIEQTMVELTPMARLGEVEDVALGALHLCSPAAGYVTGDILGVNGGMERLNMTMPMPMPRAWGGMG